MQPDDLTPPDGIYYGIDFDVYQSWQAMNKSRLGYLVPPSTPRHFRHHEDHPTDSTRAQAAGNLLDCLLLEPDEFQLRYTQRPQWANAICDVCSAAPGQPCTSTAKGKNFGKPLKDGHDSRWKLHVPTGVEITTRQLDDAQAVVREIMDHPTAGPLVKESQHQVSMIWTDPDTGARIKARPDMLSEGMADLKKCRPGDASVDRWKYVVDQYHYQIQAAMYLEGYAILTGQSDATWLWLAVETDPTGKQPTMIALHSATDDMLEAGSREWHAALKLWLHCKETGTWPGYPETPQPCYPTPRMLRGRIEAAQQLEDETAPEFPWDAYEAQQEA